jgi:hypothetical protein
MKTPLDMRGSRANDGRSARLGKKQPDGTHAHRIAHQLSRRRAGPSYALRSGGAGQRREWQSVNLAAPRPYRIPDDFSEQS